ncbi:potassium channel family protein [Mangrovimonas sp. DI 80]|uniref:potassium channel family protein n=1 Tax=Mangrovimonas sp. DI 80 TaxID=1779330 RepID=UPI000978B7B6|nr:potassium channel family protein [Mangrovimonas sp. DI 80]OMP30389.1 hypothetical protein BKM32_13490 [Mangrovimonas sp. DI 80]
MKTLTSLVLFLLVSWSSLSQEALLKEYSLSDFFRLIDNEKDSIFRLKDALIKFNSETDSTLILKTPFGEPPEPINPSNRKVIDKEVSLENVHFITELQRIPDSSKSFFLFYLKGAIENVHFKKRVSLLKCTGIHLYNCQFEERFLLNNNEVNNLSKDLISSKKLQLRISIGNNFFNKRLILVNLCDNKDVDLNYDIFLNNITTHKDRLNSGNRNRIYINLKNIDGLMFFKNQFMGEGDIDFSISASEFIEISNNNFNEARTDLRFESNHSQLNFKNNIFKTTVRLNIGNLNPSDAIELNQFKSNYFSLTAFENYRNLLPDEEFFKTDTDSFQGVYKNIIRFENAQVYTGEAALKGILYRHYRENFDMVRANQVFIDLKDFETKRLEYLFKSNPSFDTFFTWKVNQFLKVFSNYGTKPSKAIIFSLYVIIFFAIIYLFFPNSWDSHGRKRIMDRFTFFIKYMKKDAGIHEVYLEDKQPDLMEYEAFKNLLIQASPQVPKFFIKTGLPLYKWTIARTNLHASILSKFDIMKGTWQDLPLKKRFWKSILLIGAFLVASLYDLFIKILNALMLSINTFTTLGFGEIPIKGFPRYLAILQGFIGWFMLTIFSVSLISQLLN